MAEPNQVPVATAQAVTVDEDTTDNVITLAGTDADGDTLTYAIATQPAHGTLTLTGAVAKYTPTADYFGPDSFTFTVNDGTVDSTPATVTITVTDVAEPIALTRLAKDNTNHDVTLVKSIGGTDYTFKVYTNGTPTSETSQATIAVYGQVNGENVVLYVNDTYPDTVKFQIKVFDASGNEVGYSAVTDYSTSSINVGNIDIEVSIEQKIVNRHNLYRNLDFHDSNLTWDEILADHAQQWADYLATHYTQALADAGQSPHASHFNEDSHGLPYLGEGENIAWASAGLKYIRDEAVDITVAHSADVDGEFGAVDMWANEKADYDYASNSGNGNTVGHYTQVVWQKTTKVGCAKAHSTTDYPGDHVVCRYYIPGNMTGEKPYCTEYSVGQYYNDSSLVFTDALINNKIFANTKILEDRANCTVRDMTSESLMVNGDGTGTFQSFDFFNDGNYVTNFNFTKNIDAQGVLHMSGDVNGNNSVMTLKLIGQDANYYNVDAEWTLDSSNPGYTRRAIFRLAK